MRIAITQKMFNLKNRKRCANKLIEALCVCFQSHDEVLYNVSHLGDLEYQN